MSDILTLGIESSCDETSAAVVLNGRKVLSNVISTSLDLHKMYGGVVPEVASRKHVEYIVPVIDEALRTAGVKKEELDYIGVTYGPGLLGALLVGLSAAKAMAFSLEKTLVGVHHIEGHISANFLEYEELEPPFIALVASGGHSHIVYCSDYGEFKIIGRTRDDAAGEAFDKAARTMGMPYPGGVELDKVAEFGDDSAYILPHPTVADSPYDFSFSGLKTAVINLIHNAEQKGEEIHKENLCASFRKAVVGCLTDNLFKAAEDLGAETIVAAGGVSANALLRRELTRICDEKKFPLYVPALSLCGDNAAMVASQAYYEYMSGNVASSDLNAVATLPIDYR